MTELETKIFKFLLSHPNSEAKQIAAEVGEVKALVNLALYSASERLFKKTEGTPPRWIAMNPSQSDRLDYKDCQGRGLPGVMGYKTGATGDGSYKRRSILMHIMEKPLPRINSQQYMAEWGEIMSPVRLERLVNHLAVQHNTRPAGQFIDSHREWIADIDFLLERYESLGVNRPTLR
ncbi:MAG: hypothetical protein HWE20_04340 [Gammaproteobacteria bacterium]|nr:hypothetical protein [Gammaproteobacteria bacterium]